MLLEKDDLLLMFKNLQFNIVELKGLGRLVEISSYDAFDFSSITGANYLLHPVGISMKGRNETFIHRAVFQENSYIYSPGLFGRNELMVLEEENSADRLKRLYPSVFSGTKYILIENISKGQSSNIDGTIYKKIVDLGFSPSNFILYKLFESGQSQESLYEFFSAIYFINKGYIVENQTPWFQQNYLYKGERLNGGIPDFSAFKTPLFNELIKKGIISSTKGILINKLPVIKNFIEIHEVQSNYNIEYELIIGEVKSDKSSLEQANRQMEKYAKVELSNKIYSIIPNCSDNGVDSFGEIYFESQRLLIKNSSESLPINTVSQKLDSDWINTNIKLNLLGNVPFSTLIERLETEYSLSKKQIRSFHLVDFALNSSINEIFQLI